MKHFFISVILCISLLLYPQFGFSNTTHNQKHESSLKEIVEETQRMLQESMEVLEALASIDVQNDDHKETDPSSILNGENTNFVKGNFDHNPTIRYLSNQEDVRNSVEQIYENHREAFHSFFNENDLVNYLIQQEDVHNSAEYIYKSHRNFLDNVLFDSPSNTEYAYMIYHEGPNIIFNNSKEEEPEPQSGTGHAVFAIIWLIVVIACSIFTGNAHCKNTDKDGDK